MFLISCQGFRCVLRLVWGFERSWFEVFMSGRGRVIVGIFKFQECRVMFFLVYFFQGKGYWKGVGENCGQVFVDRIFKILMIFLLFWLFQQVGGLVIFIGFLKYLVCYKYYGIAVGSVWEQGRLFQYIQIFVFLILLGILLESLEVFFILWSELKMVGYSWGFRFILGFV